MRLLAFDHAAYCQMYYVTKKIKQYLRDVSKHCGAFLSFCSENELDHNLLSDNSVVLALAQKHEVELNIHG